MPKRGEIFSTNLKTKKRTYFFNVHENFNKSLSLSIVESENNDQGSYNRQSILVYDESLDEFLVEFQKSIDFLRQRQLGLKPSFEKNSSHTYLEKKSSKKEDFKKKEFKFKDKKNFKSKDAKKDFKRKDSASPSFKIKVLRQKKNKENNGKD